MSTLVTVAAGVSLAVVGVAASGLGTSEASDLPTHVDDHVRTATSLHELAAAHGVDVGVAIGPESIDDAAERAIIGHDFDTVTPENALKWEVVHPEPGSFDFGPADDLVSFALDHDLEIRGHALVWHQQNPAWFADARWGRDQAIDALSTHIRTVVGRYSGRIEQWDVVNEPLRDGGPGLRDSVWLDTIGDDYLAIAFDQAHASDPDARLFLNDYDGGDGSKYGRLVDLAISLRADGVPVHGVGFQLHLDGTLDAAAIAEQVDRAERAGLEVAFTEVDDRLPIDADSRAWAEQGVRLAELGQICVASPACTTFVVWGLSDAHSWIPHHFPEHGHGTLFDEDLAPKPAWNALARTLLSGPPIEEIDES